MPMPPAPTVGVAAVGTTGAGRIPDRTVAG
jgi:hypothetical protein